MPFPPPAVFARATDFPDLPRFGKNGRFLPNIGKFEKKDLPRLGKFGAFLPNIGKTARRAAGFTLVELAIVVAILALAATLAVPRLSALRREAKLAAARHDLETLRGAFAAYLADMAPLPRFTWVNPFPRRSHDDYEALNLRVHNLFSPTNLQSPAFLAVWNDHRLSPPADLLAWDPDAARGWRGPYLAPSPSVRPYPAPGDRRFPGDGTFAARGFFFAGAYTNILSDSSTNYVAVSCSYGTPGEFAFFDPWDNPCILQIPFFPAADSPAVPDLDFALGLRWRFARLVSAGPNGILETPVDDPCAGRLPDGTAPARGDDLVLFLNRADLHQTAPWDPL